MGSRDSATQAGSIMAALSRKAQPHEGRAFRPNGHEARPLSSIVDSFRKAPALAVEKLRRNRWFAAGTSLAPRILNVRGTAGNGRPETDRCDGFASRTRRAIALQVRLTSRYIGV